ncbi:uncharacterized protein EV422DRAFT_538450 [Fimicolochytrium jonesii]|uniref:uncharacterized protein n=1 Tax=Fimicolochytrium jonesii TaxID=1396493 RepID=UPI0022FDCF34|nr:uncharacterized protein EV422DRAFT_538450 [Fimicolochytrium jonesii]KAI8818395.1 hypothetical protein EV422DRAFT_538450 [Fimicolochytrium jonesii]
MVGFPRKALSLGKGWRARKQVRQSEKYDGSPVLPLLHVPLLPLRPSIFDSIFYDELSRPVTPPMPGPITFLTVLCASTDQKQMILTQDEEGSENDDLGFPPPKADALLPLMTVRSSADTLRMYRSHGATSFDVAPSRVVRFGDLDASMRCTMISKAMSKNRRKYERILGMVEEEDGRCVDAEECLRRWPLSTVQRYSLDTAYQSSDDSF